MKKRRLAKPWVSALFWVGWNTLRLLPLSLASRAMSTIMRIFARQLTNQPVFRENLSKAFPEMSPRWVRKTARDAAANLGRMAAELSHIDHFKGGTANGILTYSGDHQLALAQKGPVIFVGTHQCNWEIVPLLYGGHGIHVTILYADLGNSLIDRTLLAQRRKTGAEYVERSKAVRPLINALQSGRSLALLMDQRVKSGVRVNFLGRDSLMSGMPARLAIRYRCPIIPMDMERRDGHRFHTIFGKPIYPPPEGDAQTERLMTQAIADQLEKSIRKSPDTWFCSKRRWPDKAGA